MPDFGVILALIVIGGSGYGLSRVPTGFIPIEDRLSAVAVQLPMVRRSIVPSACSTGSAK